MTQRFDIRHSADVGVAFDLSAFGQLRDPDGPVEHPNPQRIEWTFYVADTETKADVISAIETQLTDAAPAWATVEYRHTLAEYDDPQYRDDETYYHETHTLRSPPEIAFIEDFTVDVSAAVVLGGGEVDVSESVAIDSPEEDAYDRTDALHATADGVVVNAEGGVELGSVCVKTPLDRIPRSGIETVAYPDGSDDGSAVIEIGTEPEPESVGERVRKLENATGADGPVKRGIAHRIDDIEGRLSALEDRL